MHWEPVRTGLSRGPSVRTALPCCEVWTHTLIFGHWLLLPLYLYKLCSPILSLRAISRLQDLIKPSLAEPAVTWARPHYHLTCYLNSAPSCYSFPPPIFDMAGSYSLLLHSLIYCMTQTPWPCYHTTRSYSFWCLMILVFSCICQLW